MKGFRTALAALSGLLVYGCAALSEDTFQSTSELGARAADPTGLGPYATTSSDYRLPAAIDPDVLAGRATEIWARVYRPAELAGPHPVLVFLHGNHGTCGRGSNPRIDDSAQYTNLGTCPSGYVVTPNHLGYAYLAERLASWGYVVVSINANRGITSGGGISGDSGLNLARGRLVLRHLERLSVWNANPGTTPKSLGVDLAGTLDLGDVGIMGHSRGGEGARAAYALYNEPGSAWPARLASPLRVKAIFEIGPVDGQTSRTLEAFGTAWNVILPMCDGDVTNLQGMRPFDRMLAKNDESPATPKGMFAVWGANHNFYNTEWQGSDARSCRGGQTPIFDANGSASLPQQTTALHGVMGFFRAHVGPNADLSFNANFDPQYALPAELERVTPIARAYADAVDESVVRVLEDFSGPQGTSLGGLPTLTENAQVTYGGLGEHDRALRAATVKWTSQNAWFQIPWSAAGSGIDASQMTTLDLRVSAHETGNLAGFSVRLVNADDTLSEPVAFERFAKLFPYTGHVVLETARLPLAAFSGADLGRVRGVRFVFDDAVKGALYMSSLRFSRAPLATMRAPLASASSGKPGPSPRTLRFTTGNRIEAIRELASSDVEISLTSPNPFPPLDELARLRLGTHDVLRSRYGDDGDLHRIVFTLTTAELAAVPQGALVKVRYGADEASQEWEFGSFDRARIQR